MIKKIMLLTFFITTIFAIQPSISFKDKTSYQKYISDMEKIYISGMGEGANALASLYQQEVLVGNERVHPDYVKAIEYHEKAISLGFEPSRFLLALAKKQAGDSIGMLEALSNAIKTGEPKTRLVAAQTYSAAILDNSPSLDAYVDKAIEIARMVSKEGDYPVLQYMLAHLYNLKGDMGLADAFLNLACKNTKASKKIMQNCYQSGDIEVIDNDGKNLGTCPFSDQ